MSNFFTNLHSKCVPLFLFVIPSVMSQACYLKQLTFLCTLHDTYAHLITCLPTHTIQAHMIFQFSTWLMLKILVFGYVPATQCYYPIRPEHATEAHTPY